MEQILTVQYTAYTAENEQVTHWCGNLWLGSIVVRALDLQLTVMSSNDCNMAIFQDGGRRHLGFLFFIFNGRNGQECRTTSLCQILSKLLTAVDISHFSFFFKMAAAVILDLRNLKLLTVSTVKKVEPRHRAKFRRNRSNRG